MATPPNFETSLNYAKHKLNINFELKDQQLSTLRHLYEGNDCIAVLPKGYGKSVIFQLLPWLLQKDLSVPGMVIVVCPLNSLMQDQVMSLGDRGIKACFLNSQGTAGKTYKMISRQIDVETLEEEDNDQDEVDATENDIHAPTYVKMKELQQGQFNIIYAHPETLLNNKTVGRLLRSPLFQEKVCAVVVDEVHMISEWMPKFRTAFKKLSEVICIFANAAHLALTATATRQAIKELVADLQIVDFKTIRINPDWVNIFLEIQTRLPNIRKQEKLDNLIQPLAEDLCDRLAEFPLTVVYINNDEALGYCYQYVARHLKERHTFLKNHQFQKTEFLLSTTRHTKMK